MASIYTTPARFRRFRRLHGHAVVDSPGVFLRSWGISQGYIDMGVSIVTGNPKMAGF